MADTSRAAEFYRTARGAVAAQLVRDRLTLMWPDLSREAVLGLGYAAPYLRQWRDQAARCVAAVPDDPAPGRWPLGAPNLHCAVEEDALPFPDLSFDRVLLVHGLEAAFNVRGMLRETWRVLKDDGRLLVVAPNRLGLWAHVESTPFGQGQPYSPGQIARTLAGGMFRIERRDAALYVPPTNLRLVLRSAALWDRAGRAAAATLAGVTITEAVKDAYAGLPLRAPARRRLVRMGAG